MLNPELQRNIWLNISLQKLFAAPIILGAILGLAYLIGKTAGGSQAESVTVTASTLFWIIAVFWGTRRAANGVMEELSQGTWESQRMSAMSAWSMSWGKLFGATIYVWYCAGICLLAFIAFIREVSPSFTEEALFAGSRNSGIVVFNMVVGALLAQSLSMFAAMLLLQRAHAARRLSITFCQTFGIGGAYLITLTAQILPAILRGASGGSVASLDRWINQMNYSMSWYGVEIPALNFYIITLVLAMVWGVVGIYRLMRQELQYRNYPFVWIGFTLFVMIYLGGLAWLEKVPNELRHLGEPPLSWQIPFWLTLFLIPSALTYLAVFAQSKSIVSYFWFGKSLREGEFKKSLYLCPAWMIAYGIALIAGILFWFSLPSLDASEIRKLGQFYRDIFGQEGHRYSYSVLAHLLFITRDILFVLWLNFRGRPKRADIAALIYLLIAYVVLPPLVAQLFAFGVPEIVAVFSPVGTANPVMKFLPIFIQVGVLAVLLARIWRQIGQQIEGRQPVPAMAS